MIGNRAVKEAAMLSLMKKKNEKYIALRILGKGSAF